mgnify:CR=1 FL=1
MHPLLDDHDPPEPMSLAGVLAARDAGAWDVRALAAPGDRPRLSLRPRPAAALATLHRLRLEYGFPREMAGRG